MTDIHAAFGKVVAPPNADNGVENLSTNAVSGNPTTPVPKQRRDSESSKASLGEESTSDPLETEPRDAARASKEELKKGQHETPERHGVL